MRTGREARWWPRQRRRSARPSGRAALEAAGRRPGGSVRTSSPCSTARRPPPRRRAITERLVREAEGDMVLEANLSGFLAAHEAMSGRFDAARAHIAQSNERLRDLGLKWQVGVQEHLGGYIEMFAGDPAAAERHMRIARDSFVAIGDSWSLSTVSVDLPRPVYEQGRYDEARSLVAEIDEVPAPADREWQIKRRCLHARLLAREGRFGEAERPRSRGRRDRHRNRPAVVSRRCADRSRRDPARCRPGPGGDRRCAGRAAPLRAQGNRSFRSARQGARRRVTQRRGMTGRNQQCTGTCHSWPHAASARAQA